MTDDTEDLVESFGDSHDEPSTELITIQYGPIEYQVMIDIMGDYKPTDELSDLAYSLAHAAANDINDFDGVLASVRTVDYSYTEQSVDERHNLDFDPDTEDDD